MRTLAAYRSRSPADAQGVEPAIASGIIRPMKAPCAASVPRPGLARAERGGDRGRALTAGLVTCAVLFAHGCSGEEPATVDGTSRVSQQPLPSPVSRLLAPEVIEAVPQQQQAAALTATGVTGRSSVDATDESRPAPPRNGSSRQTPLLLALSALFFLIAISLVLVGRRRSGSSAQQLNGGNTP